MFCYLIIMIEIGNRSTHSNRDKAISMFGAISLATLASSCGAGASHPKFNHAIKEPVCTGISTEQIDADLIRIVPKLKGSFINPAHVVTYLVVESGQSPTPAASNKVNASGGGTTYAQHGIGFKLGAQDAPQSPAQIKLFDYQKYMPVAHPGNEVPEGVPEIDCPIVPIQQPTD